MTPSGHNSAAAVCAEFAQSFSRGDFVSREWFWERAGYDPASDSATALAHYMRFMGRIHSTLQDDHKIILVETEGGYRLPLPKEHAAIARRRVSHGITAAFAAGDIALKTTPRGALSVDERKELSDAENHISRLSQMMGKKARDPFE